MGSFRQRFCWFAGGNRLDVTYMQIQHHSNLRRWIDGHRLSNSFRLEPYFEFRTSISDPERISNHRNGKMEGCQLDSHHSAGCWFSQVRMCCIRSGGSIWPSGNGQVKRSDAASCVAPRRSERSSLHHICTNRPMARPRRRNRPTSTRASSSQRDASANSSVQSTTHSTSIRASSSPRPRVRDSSRTISRTRSSHSTDMSFPRPIGLVGGPSPNGPPPSNPLRCSHVVVRRRIPVNRSHRKREIPRNRAIELAQLAADGSIDYLECQP
jgi:hypothetical protein